LAFLAPQVNGLGDSFYLPINMIILFCPFFSVGAFVGHYQQCYAVLAAPSLLSPLRAAFTVISLAEAGRRGHLFLYITGVHQVSFFSFFLCVCALF